MKEKEQAWEATAQLTGGFRAMGVTHLLAEQSYSPSVSIVCTCKFSCYFLNDNVLYLYHPDHRSPAWHLRVVPSITSQLVASNASISSRKWTNPLSTLYAFRGWNEMDVVSGRSHSVGETSFIWFGYVAVEMRGEMIRPNSSAPSSSNATCFGSRFPTVVVVVW